MKIFKHTILLAVSLMMTACTVGYYGEDDFPMDGYVGQDPELSFDGENVIEVGKYGGEYDITFTANLPWKVSSMVPWMEILGDNKGLGGPEKINVRFLVSKNASIVPREGRISVKISDDAEIYLTIRQQEMTLEELSNDWFVKPGAEGDGSSWEEAMDLNLALQSCANGDKIHIAAGTYTPEILAGGTEEGHKTFLVSSNVSLIGGYPADAKDGDTPDPAVNRTILSGAGKAHHVMVVAALRDSYFTADINGLVITEGVGAPKAGSVAMNDSRLYASQGSGLSVVNSRAVFTGCEITGNTATAGTAGLIAHESDVTFKDCIISNNTSNKNAPGIWSSAGNVVFDGCVISGNVTSSGVGGGLYCLDAANNKRPTNTYVYNSLIIGNGNEASKSSRRGGGAYLREGSNTVMVNTTITGNIAGNGGGVATYQVDGAPTSLLMISCTVTDNEATSDGGGVECYAGVTAKIYNTIVSGNKATGGSSDIMVGGASIDYSIKGSTIYGAAGEVVSGTFSYDGMLGTLAEGVYPLVGEDNPALTMGMPLDALKAITSGLTPEMDVTQLGRDQKGNERTTSVMGAYVGQ